MELGAARSVPAAAASGHHQHAGSTQGGLQIWPTGRGREAVLLLEVHPVHYSVARRVLSGELHHHHHYHFNRFQETGKTLGGREGKDRGRQSRKEGGGEAGRNGKPGGSNGKGGRMERNAGRRSRKTGDSEGNEEAL